MLKSITKKVEACPCGSALTYDQCCKLIHLDHSKAKTAEMLMRARFSAFVLSNVPFLVETLHVSKRQVNDREGLALSCAQNDWLSLRVLEVSHNSVEFVAFYNTSRFDQLHEISRFVFEGGLWFYFDGKIEAPIKISRNELCPCGSGVKYKRCCL